MSTPIQIDTKMHGREGVTACFLITGERNALIETGAKTSLEHVTSELERHGVDRLDLIAVTHIHLDHAGAAGSLAALHPEAEIAVHHVGARHLADPSKLWASAGRIYGDQMETLWGGMDPIDESRIRALSDGDELDLGGGRSLRAVETPGHAGHHHVYVDSETGIVFTGDALGVRLADVGKARPATPPPEFDLEAYIDSIERIRAIQPHELWLTHFGSQKPQSFDETCDEAIAALRMWAEWITEARKATSDIDEVSEIVRAKVLDSLEDDMTEAQIDRMEQTSSYRMSTWGYMRYFDKKEEAEAS